MRHAQIRVNLSVGKAQGQTVFKERIREQDYTGEPSWSGRWREPWGLGFFTYTVTATYKGNVYTTVFKVGKDAPTSAKPEPPTESGPVPPETKPAGPG